MINAVVKAIAKTAITKRCLERSLKLPTRNRIVSAFSIAQVHIQSNQPYFYR